MKRLFYVLISFVILVTLLSSSVFAVRDYGEIVDPSSNAELFDLRRVPVVKWHDLNDTHWYQTSNWQTGYINIGTGASYPGSTDTKDYEILPFYELPSGLSSDFTYLFNMKVGIPILNQVRSGFDINNNSVSGLSFTYGSDFDVTTTVHSDIYSGTPLSDLVDYFSYAIVPDDSVSSQHRFSLQFVVHSSHDISLDDLKYIAPRLFSYGMDDPGLVQVLYFNQASWADPYLNYYQQLTLSGINDILQSIDSHSDLTISEIQSARDMINQNIQSLDSSIQAAASQAHSDAQAVQSKIDAAADQAHEDQGVLQDLISGDPSDAVDSSSLSDDLSDLDDVESDIYDRLDLTVTLGDEEVSLDASIFSKIDDYLDGIEAERFDTDVGSQFNKIWDLIFGYLAIPIILTLTLGSALAFLKGRSKA